MAIWGFQTTFLREPGFPDTHPGIGFEVQGRDVIEHQCCRPQLDVSGASSCQMALPLRGRVESQSTFPGPIRSSRDVHLVEDPDTVTFAGQLNQPNQHELFEHFVTIAGLVEIQSRETSREHAPQIEPWRNGSATPTLRQAVPEIQLVLTLPNHSLSDSGSQHFQLRWSVSRTDVVHPPRPSRRLPHHPNPQTTKTVPNQAKPRQLR